MGHPYNLPCSIVDVVNLLGIKVVRNTGNQLHCRCPFCNDRKAHLNVKVSADVFRCNRCGKGGGVLHLYAYAHDMSLSSAYEELCRIYNSPASGDNKLLIRKMPIVSAPDMPLASSSVRDNTYRNLLSLLTLGTSHRESLLKRGLSNDDILTLGYKTTPAVRTQKIVTQLLDMGCQLKGVPGFYCDENGQWKLDIRGSGIMIPDRNFDGEIEAIQIRLDKVRKSKFNNLTSVDRYYGTAASCCPHYIGLHPDSTSIILTEGIMKADIAYTLSSRLNHESAYVGITGVGNRNQFLRILQELQRTQIRDIHVAFDMDYSTNQNVMDARKRVLEVGSEYGYNMTPLLWNQTYKGIDDLILHLLTQDKLIEKVQRATQLDTKCKIEYDLERNEKIDERS